MKRKYALKAFTLLIISNVLFLTSCSSMWLHRGETVDSVQQGKTAYQPNMVPKEQFDELNRKYNELIINSKNQISRNESPAEVVAPHVVDDNFQTKPLVGDKTAIDPSDLVNRIDKEVPSVASLDTVDALKPDVPNIHEKGPPLPTSMGVQEVNNTDDIDDQISRLREVQELVKVNKFDAALSILKELENAKEKQIVVRAKMMLGDLLFNQNEYDLASQVYEEVIKKYAFSGLVLKAMSKLIVCSEKLKQPEKQAKYYSLLHDFFEAT